MIRNCIFRYQSLDISYSSVKIKDSRHFQLAIYSVFHAESESAARIDQFLHPEEKNKKNQPMRISISYRKISYYMSPPYIFPLYYGAVQAQHTANNFLMPHTSADLDSPKVVVTRAATKNKTITHVKIRGCTPFCIDSICFPYIFATYDFNSCPHISREATCGCQRRT